MANHLAGRKHAKMMDSKKDPIPNIPCDAPASVSAAPSPSDLFCKVCNISTTGLQGMATHLAGRKHARMMDPVQNIPCDICNIVLAGSSQYEAHIIGKKHLKKQEQHEEQQEEQQKGQQKEQQEGQQEQGDSEAPAPAPTGDCQDSVQEREEGCRQGEKADVAVATLEQPPLPPDAQPQAQDAVGQKVLEDGSSKFQEEKAVEAVQSVSPRPSLYSNVDQGGRCDVCDVGHTSESARVAHESGKRHAKRVKALG